MFIPKKNYSSHDKHINRAAAAVRYTKAKWWKYFVQKLYLCTLYIHIARLHLSFMSDDELFEKVKLWIVIKACNSNTFSGDCDTKIYKHIRYKPQNDFIIEMRGLKLIVWLKAHHGSNIKRFWTQNSLQFHNAY